MVYRLRNLKYGVEILKGQGFVYYSTGRDMVLHT